MWAVSDLNAKELETLVQLLQGTKRADSDASVCFASIRSQRIGSLTGIRQTRKREGLRVAMALSCSA